MVSIQAGVTRLAQAATSRMGDWLQPSNDNIPISLADACPVHMAERHSKCRVLTLDGDLRLSGKPRREMIQTVMPHRL